MAGPWPLAPHHDHLQFIQHVHLMIRGQNRDITSLLHLRISVEEESVQVRMWMNNYR